MEAQVEDAAHVVQGENAIANAHAIKRGDGETFAQDAIAVRR
jgi:hypothetical protein